MGEMKLYFCLEAKNKKQGNYNYMIYSAKLREERSDSKPDFTLEAIIPGFPYMGCGLFGSKLVFAGGGFVEQAAEAGYQKITYTNRQCITYDTTTTHVSRKDFPPMHEHTCLNVWTTVRSPYITRWSSKYSNRFISGRTPYSWFVFGNCVCMSLPGEYDPLTNMDCFTYIHHARQISRTFRCRCFASLPFHGMATTYYQHSFDDVVVISFFKGRVEGRRLIMNTLLENPSSSPLGDPIVIFETEPYEPDGELCCYFADCCEKGRFCLTTSHNSNIHLYIFQIRRDPDLEDGTLKLSLISKVMYRYDLKNFSTRANKSFGFLGCFVPTPGARKKQIREAELYRAKYNFCETTEKGREDPPLNDRSHEPCFSMDSDEDTDEFIAL